MRMTPSQIDMWLLLGERPAMLPEWGLKERIRRGHAGLVKTTGKDFGFDPHRWHDYLRETKEDGYRWSGIAKKIGHATTDPAWCRAVAELQNEETAKSGKGAAERGRPCSRCRP
jgi:hypothetical protein